MENLVLIDGNSLINRAFYAMPVLSTKDGVYTNGVYGFMNMFFKMLSDVKPSYVAVAFDLKAPTFRHKIFADYKGTRKPMPMELRPQIPLLKNLLKLMGVTVIEKEGSEADDIIGTIAKHTDINTVIFTGDKDSFQLVDEQTEVHFTKRGITETEIYNAENFFDKTGISPIQIIELKALMGDSSDNIPGVSGIGEKTALSLLNTYQNIDNLYANIDNITGKLKEKLIIGKESAYLSKTLATIDCDCGVNTDVESMRFSMPLSSEVRKKFIELEFKSLYKRDELFDQSALEETKDYTKSDSLKEVKVHTVLDFNELSPLKTISPIALFIGEDAVHLSEGKTEFIIPIKKSLIDDGLDFSAILNAITPFITGENALILFNKKDFKHKFFALTSVALSAPTEDVSLMKYLTDFSGKDETLLDVIESYALPLSTPACSLYYLYSTLIEKLKETDTFNLYKKVELPLADILYQMEVSGFKVDVDALNEAGEKYTAKIIKLEEQIRTLCDEPTLNVNSPLQLGNVLFEKLRIGKGKKTKRGYSTSADVLESFEDAHPVIPLILKHRQLQKIHSTYIEGFKPLIEKGTGLIHTSFNQTVTATGRLSSKEPNLQNIPVREDEGKEIRKFFVPRDENRILVGADYSQIELRLLAAFSESESLIKAFCEGQDVHSATASKVFNVPLSSVTPKQRSNAKAVNFGVIYGISEFGLAKTLKIESFEARNFINSYFKQYPKVKQYMDENKAKAKACGYSQTILKRRRYIPELSSSNFNMRSFGERVAMNMPLQGSSADIIKLAMIGVYNRLKKENLKSELILQIHDELIVDALISEKDRVETILKEEMEGAITLSVPLTVSVESGKTWFDAK